jgi:hypothetical protein
MRKTSIWGNRTGKANFFRAYCISRLTQMQFATHCMWMSHGDGDRNASRIQ